MAEGESEGGPRGRNFSENGSYSRDDVLTDSFSLFRTYFDEQFSNFKRELRDEVHSSSADAIRRFKGNSTEHEFKYRGNKKQYSFNLGIIQELDIISDLVKHGERRQLVLDNLTDVKRKLARRNKLIKIADKSPAGWNTVDEYVSDEVASDSEDDKKIRRAEKRALEKRSSKVDRKPSATVTSAASPGYGSMVNGSFSGGNFPQQLFRAPRRGGPFLQCFGCGGWGHTRPECPAKLQIQGSNAPIRGFSGIPWQRGNVEQTGQIVPVKVQGSSQSDDK